ncbi:MAG: hypothetical protein D6760_08795 [Deltaproteobacteria bacterium]|nr:MAG: hypothetical protein D6760_08795 [Deltaproteobacteria bacterium]
MRRLLQIVSALMFALALALAWRIVLVMQVETPAIGDVRQVAAIEPLPPPPRRPTPTGTAIDAIVGGNLFELERGQRPDEDADAGEAPPLPPPTNVTLNGVFVREGEPMAILTDAGAGGRQLTVRVGENVGDYEVGEITADRVTLLGSGGQRFLLELDIKKGAVAGRPATGAAGARPVPGRPTPGRPPTPPRPAVRTPAQARAAAAAERAAAGRTAAAQRAAAARARAAQNRAAQARTPERVDPTQARLEALKRLREAAQGR